LKLFKPEDVFVVAPNTFFTSVGCLIKDDLGAVAYGYERNDDAPNYGFEG